jgi:membrane associated rhomboid family serine protease
MIPIGDDNVQGSGIAYINILLVVINTLVFLVEASMDQNALQAFINQWGVIPTEILAGNRLITLLTGMFMHGGWLHLIFNMWALWIFGDNIEDYLGHFPYLVFYLLAGIAGTALHTLMNLTSAVPSVGASGAIAGVMGAYMLLYPNARVTTLVPFFFIFFIRLPAWLVLGYWFVIQFLSGAAMSIAYTRQTSGGVAVWAHVGGFVAGIVLVKIFPARVRRTMRFSGW